MIRSKSSSSGEESSSSSSSTADGDVNRARDIYALISGARIVDELYQRITKKREIEQAWSGVVLRVADYVKKNPRATEQQLVDHVRSELKSFEIFVNAL